MINTVLFDMDGVLIDARDWHFQALNFALNLFGVPISEDEHDKFYDGLPTKKKLEYLSQKTGLPLRLHEFINELKQAYTTEFIINRCAPDFHHQYALMRLRQAGFNVAVCSNSIRATMELMLTRADVINKIDFFLSNEDVKCAKPDPEIYLVAMQKFGVEAKNCLVVEDNPHGVAAATASGAHVLVVNDPSDVTWERIKERMDELAGV